MVTLYCPDCPGLKLGPGVPPDPNVVVFVDGYVTLDENDPLFDLKMAWTHTFGSPPIRVLDEDEVPANDPGAVPCPACGMTFATDRKLNGHILGAHRKKE